MLFPCLVVSRNTLMEICGVVIEATSNFSLFCDFQTDSILGVSQRSEVMNCSCICRKTILYVLHIYIQIYFEY